MSKAKGHTSSRTLIFGARAKMKTNQTKEKRNILS